MIPEELILPDIQAWRSWLEKHHSDVVAVWLVLAKKGTTDPTSLTYGQALDVGLCYGWIDGQRRSRDTRTFAQRFTPRGPRSAWSKRNVAIVERLRAAGLMHPRGLSEVERAQKDGRWDFAYAGQATIEMPADFATALAACPGAGRMYATLTSQNRYAFLYRLGAVKRAETRARKIERFVEMLERGETIHPQGR